MRFWTLPVLLVVLSGCIPPGLTVASYAVDGVSYVGTGKSLTDHMLSDMMSRDCATWRVIKSRPICKDFTPEEIAQRKANRESIRHDVDHAYIATNLDGIDFDKDTGLATTGKPRVTAPAVRPAAGGGDIKPVPPKAPRDPSAPKASDKPVRLKPAPVEREDLPGARGKPLVKRPANPNAAHYMRGVRPRRAGDRYLVFGSFRHRGEAVRFAGRHAVMQPTIVPVRVRGKRYYRVVVRPDGREALAMARSRLRRNGVTDAYTMRVCRSGAAAAHCMTPPATTHLGGRTALRRISGGG